MKSILRYFLINLVSLWVTTEIVKGLTYSGGYKSLLTGALVFTIINFLLVPLLKVLLLPLNLLTLGFFSWITNVLALYALTTVMPQFKLMPFFFQGIVLDGFTIPSAQLSVLWVAIIASFLIGIFTHFLQWLVR